MYYEPFLLLICRLYRRSEEHTSELQSRLHLVCRLLLEKKVQCRNRHTLRCSALISVSVHSGGAPPPPSPPSTAQPARPPRDFGPPGVCNELFERDAAHRDVHTFPTRRSSD